MLHWIKKHKNTNASAIPVMGVMKCAAVHIWHMEAKTRWQLYEDVIFKCIFLNGNFPILTKIHWLKFITKCPFDEWTLVQEMAWRRMGDKPLSEVILTHVCVTLSEWVHVRAFFFAVVYTALNYIHGWAWKHAWCWKPAWLPKIQYPKN